MGNGGTGEVWQDGGGCGHGGCVCLGVDGGEGAVIGDIGDMGEGL